MGHSAVNEYCRVNSRTAVQAYQSATARFIYGRKLVGENANQWFLSSRQGNPQPIEKALLGHGGRFWREGVPSRRAGSAGERRCRSARERAGLSGGCCLSHCRFSSGREVRPYPSMFNGAMVAAYLITGVMDG